MIRFRFRFDSPLLHAVRVTVRLNRALSVDKVGRCVRPGPYRAGAGPPVTPIPIRFRRRIMSGHRDGRVLGGDSEQPRAGGGSRRPPGNRPPSRAVRNLNRHVRVTSVRDSDRDSDREDRSARRRPRNLAPAAGGEGRRRMHRATARRTPPVAVFDRGRGARAGLVEAAAARLGHARAHARGCERDGRGGRLSQGRGERREEQDQRLG